MKENTSLESSKFFSNKFQTHNSYLNELNSISQLSEKRLLLIMKVKWKRTSSLLKSKSLSSSTPRYEKVRKVLLFFNSAATAGSVISWSALIKKSTKHQHHPLPESQRKQKFPTIFFLERLESLEERVTTKTEWQAHFTQDTPSIHTNVTHLARPHKNLLYSIHVTSSSTHPITFQKLFKNLVILSSFSDRIHKSSQRGLN